jgi:hypothetical protein
MNRPSHMCVHGCVISVTFASKLLQKHMGYIIEYAKHGTLDESTTMTHIVQVVQAAAHSAMDLGDANPSASLR